MKLFKSGGKLHWAKNLYLRYRDGAGCCDVFSLYSYLTPNILRGLKAFKNYNRCSYPMGLTEKEWEEILDKMIYAFESIELDNRCEKFDDKKAEEGFELFGKWFRNLWI